RRARGPGIGPRHRQRSHNPRVNSSRSGWRKYDVHARRDAQLAAPLPAMQEPHAGGDQDEYAEHDEAERAGEIAKHGAERMTHKIADRDKAHRPQPGSSEVQPEKAVPANRAQPKRKRGDIAHAIDEAKRQDEA